MKKLEGRSKEIRRDRSENTIKLIFEFDSIYADRELQSLESARADELVTWMKFEKKDKDKSSVEDSREVNLLKMLHKADCTDNRSTWCEMEKSLDKMAKNTSDGTEKCNWKADVGVKLLESDGGIANLE
nr:hypothetical protein Iba_chr03cCG7330 [Ipomoea batatas]